MFIQIVTLFAVTLSVLGDDSHAISEQKVVIRHQPQNHNVRINYGHKKIEHHEEYARTYPSYEFSYKVSDPNTKDMKAQHESRDGDKVKGTYWLVEPTGNKRTVKYSANDDEGFQAKIRYSAIRKMQNEFNNQKDDSKKQNKSEQNDSNELIENNKEEIVKIKKNGHRNNNAKLNQKNRVHNPTNVASKTKPQMDENIKMDRDEEQNNQELSKEISSKTKIMTKASDKVKSNEEFQGDIGEEANREIKQIRHRLNKNLDLYASKNNYANDEKTNPESHDEIKSVHGGSNEKDGSGKETNKEIIKPVIEIFSDTVEEYNDNNNQNNKNNIAKDRESHNKNNIKNCNYARVSNNNEANEDDSKRESFRDVNTNNSEKSNEKSNQDQSAKRNKGNNRINRGRNNLGKKNEHGDTNLNNKLENSARVLEDKKEAKESIEPIINIKNSKNNKEARANYYREITKENQNSSNKDGNSKEEIFEHHIVVYHS